jgi:hypothetical protein
MNGLYLQWHIYIYIYIYISGIMYCLYLKQYMDMHSYVIVSTVTHIYSNALISKVTKYKGPNSTPQKATTLSSPYCMCHRPSEISTLLIFLNLSCTRKGAVTDRLEGGRGYAMETRELCSIPSRGRDFPLLYRIRPETGSSGLLPSECWNFFLWR